MSRSTIDRPPKRPVGRPPVGGTGAVKRTTLWMTEEQWAVDNALKDRLGMNLAELYRYYRHFFHTYGDEDIIYND